jgi:hypothetical protein
MLLVIVGLASDLGPGEQARSVDLQPVIFAAAFGSH